MNGTPQGRSEDLRAVKAMLAVAKDPEDQKPGDLDTAHATRMRCNTKGGNFGYRCTREAGHSGQHITGDTVIVIDTWERKA